MNLDDAANTILESSYGIHALVVYSESAVLRESFGLIIQRRVLKKKMNLFVWHHSMKQFIL